MILGLGKRYPSVEDEGIIWNVMIKQIKQIFAGILMGFGKRNMGNEISKGWCRIRKPITIIITFSEFSILTTSLKDNVYWNECGYLFKFFSNWTERWDSVQICHAVQRSTQSQKLENQHISSHT